MVSMNFTKLARTITFASLCFAPTVALGQSRSDPPTSFGEWQKAAGGMMEFEAASIRQDKSGVFKTPSIALSPDDGWQPTDGLFHADFPLSVYIEFAYKLLLAPEQRQAMLASLPKWVSTDIFEIHARAAGKPTKDQLRLMMQSLLAERFGLKVHFESQETPVLALTLIKAGKLGPHLSAHADICEASKAAGNGSAKDDIFPPPCLDGSFFMVPRPNHVRRMGTRNVTTALIAASLPTLGDLGRPVVDQTGLRGPTISGLNGG